MKQLSKDYRLVLICTIIGLLIALCMIHLPEWISNNYFWQIACYSLMAAIVFIVVSMYRNAGKLAANYNVYQTQ